MRIVVVGGGPGGLGAAVPLANAGHDVLMLDRDPASPSTDEEAWTGWERRSVPQLRQPHFFLARLWKELARTAPTLRDALEAADPAVVKFAATMPPFAVDRDPIPEDDELVGHGFRRTTFERVLRSWLATQDHLTLRCGTVVRGLVAESGAVPRVRGVELDDGTTIEADLVVAATGRHGAAMEWLAAIGAGPVDDDEADSGLAYYSRYYRVAPEAERRVVMGGPQQDCGSLVVFTFPADHGTFSLTFTPLTTDTEMRGLIDNDAFTRLAELVPKTAAWLADGAAEPISDVARLGRIEDRRRRVVADGRPAATGIVLTGDAAFCTNPTLGRGTSVAWVGGRRLAETVDEYGDDLEKVVLAFDEISERELRPWYDNSLDIDRQRFAAMQAHARGEAPPPPDLSTEMHRVMAAVQSTAPLDGTVFRAMLRRFNLLDPLDAIMSNHDVINRAMALREQAAALPAPPAPPSRAEMLAALAG